MQALNDLSKTLQAWSIPFLEKYMHMNKIFHAFGKNYMYILFGEEPFIKP